MYNVDRYHDRPDSKWVAQNTETLALAFGDGPVEALQNLIEQEKANG